MSPAVPPAARARDAVAFALVVAGAGAYFVAWRGMQALAERQVTAAKGEFLMTQWNSYQQMSRLGIAGIVAGAAVAAWSFHRFRQPPVVTPAPPPDALPR